MAVRTNLCTYPSFELGTTTATGWSSYTQAGMTGIYTVTTDPATDGQAKNQHLVISGDTIGKYTRLTIYSPNDSFAPGDKCTVSFYAKASDWTNVKCNVSIKWYDNSTTKIGDEFSGTINFTSSYAQYSFTPVGVAPASTARVQVWIYITSLTAAPSAAIDYDCAMIEKATSVGTYFDGATTRSGYTYAWTGGANESTSTETEAAAGLGPRAWWFS